MDTPESLRAEIGRLDAAIAAYDGRTGSVDVAKAEVQRTAADVVAARAALDRAEAEVHGLEGLGLHRLRASLTRSADDDLPAVTARRDSARSALDDAQQRADAAVAAVAAARKGLGTRPGTLREERERVLGELEAAVVASGSGVGRELGEVGAQVRALVVRRNRLEDALERAERASDLIGEAAPLLREAHTIAAIDAYGNRATGVVGQMAEHDDIERAARMLADADDDVRALAAVLQDDGAAAVPDGLDGPVLDVGVEGAAEARRLLGGFFVGLRIRENVADTACRAEEALRDLERFRVRLEDADRAVRSALAPLVVRRAELLGA